MKTLLILRHAKAEPQEEGQTDHQRALAPRGERDAPQVGKWLLQQQLVPSVILSSNAARARRTAEFVAEACQFAGDIQFLPALYLATPDTYFEALAQEAADAACVLVVGHNPTLDDLLRVLCGGDESFPTGGLAVVELDIQSWRDAQSSAPHHLAHFVRGKDL